MDYVTVAQWEFVKKLMFPTTWQLFSWMETNKKQKVWWGPVMKQSLSVGMNFNCAGWLL